LTTCKCGRKIPDNAICLCSMVGESVTVYTGEDFIPPTIPDFHQNQNKAKSVDPRIEYSRNLWKLLHTYQYKSEQETKEWFENWLKKLPCGECRNHTKILLESSPMDFSNQKGFFESGVKLHNLVNKKLDKTEISIEEATKLWLN